jgi:hypothetical protein
MRKGDKAIITNRFHAYFGQTIVISHITYDDEGELIYFFRDRFGREVMLDASDVQSTNKEGTK